MSSESVFGCVLSDPFDVETVRLLTSVPSRWSALVRALRNIPAIRVRGGRELVQSTSVAVDSSPDDDWGPRVREELRKLRDDIRTGRIRALSDAGSAALDHWTHHIDFVLWEDCLARVPEACVVKSCRAGFVGLVGPLPLVFQRMEIVDPGFRDGNQIYLLLRELLRHGAALRQMVVCCETCAADAESNALGVTGGIQRRQQLIDDAVRELGAVPLEGEDGDFVNLKVHIRIHDRSAHDRAISFSAVTRGADAQLALGIGNPLGYFVPENGSRACIVTRLSANDYREIRRPWDSADGRLRSDADIDVWFPVEALRS